MRWILLALLLPAFVFAEDDLEEAVVIQAPKETRATSAHSDSLRYRAYAFAEGRWRSVSASGVQDFQAPYLEADATVDFKPSERLKLFVDGVGMYSAYTSAFSAQMNQVGLRVHEGNWVFAAGRERNRRSPGLFVSPSDPLHTNPALAGPREIRTGEWIARASFQGKDQSTDVMYVPFRRLTNEGLPNESPRAEFWLRHFHKVAGLDVDLSAGYLDGQAKAGASLLGFVASVWKLYAELGYQATPVWSALGGVAYEGSDDFNVRAELLYNSVSSTTPVPLPAGYVVIASVVFPEVRDKFNFYVTGMQSLSTAITVGLVRAEWLATSRNTIGTSFLRAPNQDLQWSLDWRFSL